ncbi:MAG: glycosyltransferase [Deltaproteobacteria bacterium]|nr:glycosyltransferase [Deltaproteobacteria bacterium]
MQEAQGPAWPHHIGILNDYVRIPYANGSSFASQRLYREFVRRGHQVTVVGPHDPLATARELPRRHLMVPAIPLRNHPGVQLPLPSRAALRAGVQADFDVLLGQTGSAFTEYGVFLRLAKRVPFLCVNTIHLPSVYNVVLPDWLNRSARVRRFLEQWAVPKLEKQAAATYNRSDGLIVLSEGLKHYWQDRGVHVPISVIPRSIDVQMFEAPGDSDPFDPTAKRGGRLLVLCRHTREKAIARLLCIFAQQIAPYAPDATLTLVGDGPDHDAFRALAHELGVAHRTFFPGECAASMAPVWYRHADLFVYTSLSETYGQVISEAAWCGLPAVAFADGMGVSHQIEDDETGMLIEPQPETQANLAFAAATLSLLMNPVRRRAVSEAARRRAQSLCTPQRAIAKHYEAFELAREHCRSQAPSSTFMARNRALGRWSVTHMLAYLAGLMRPPAVVNRHKRLAPLWDETEQALRDLGLPLQAAPLHEPYVA